MNKVVYVDFTVECVWRDVGLSLIYNKRDLKMSYNENGDGPSKQIKNKYTRKQRDQLTLKEFE